MFFVYVLKSLSRKYLYVGLTNNPERRLDEHQNGKEKTTAPYRPFERILLEQFSDRIDARKREKYLKSGVGKEYIKENFS